MSKKTVNLSYSFLYVDFYFLVEIHDIEGESNSIEN